MKSYLWVSLAAVLIIITGCAPSARELTDEPLTVEPIPEILPDLSQQPESFEACDLLIEDEFASVLGTPVGEPHSSIGEMVDHFYDCSVMDDTQSNIVTYSIHVAGSPSSAMELFRQSAQPNSPDAAELSLPNVGTRAYFWQLDKFQYQANVLRGNVVFNFLFFVTASPENEQHIRELIALVVNRLFEQYGATR